MLKNIEEIQKIAQEAQAEIVDKEIERLNIHLPGMIERRAADGYNYVCYETQAICINCKKLLEKRLVEVKKIYEKAGYAIRLIDGRGTDTIQYFFYVSWSED